MPSPSVSFPLVSTMVTSPISCVVSFTLIELFSFLEVASILAHEHSVRRAVCTSGVGLPPLLGCLSPLKANMGVQDAYPHKTIWHFERNGISLVHDDSETSCLTCKNKGCVNYCRFQAEPIAKPKLVSTKGIIYGSLWNLPARARCPRGRPAPLLQIKSGLARAMELDRFSGQGGFRPVDSPRQEFRKQ